MTNIEIREVLEYLPHRYPFLLIDRVLQCEPGKRVLALKNVTINEPFFQGHFPYYPVMPGVLIVEAMAQAAAILTFHSEKAKADERSVYYFVGIDNARFKKPVVPGDSLRLDVSINRVLRGIWKFDAKALVDEAVVAESQLMCTVRKIDENA
ncbi:MAG: 3-hydroxyacyl-ACP dehydratase [Betaproteobacteria bacterium SG8_41]|nr:MAG: 3-hydroxyacyl-ACP dehydratase [Betaproteobacteria bacterium SG8_41]